jgi:hypothetical protein
MHRRGNLSIGMFRSCPIAYACIDLLASHRGIHMHSQGVTTYAIRKATTAVMSAILKGYGYDLSTGLIPARQAAAVGN